MVDSKVLSTGPLDLERGGRIEQVEIGYETYGDPANAARDTILLLHGYTSSPHAGGGGEDDPGWWENMIGSGRAMDTDRYFVVTPNMLGSCYGTTGPASIDPATGAPYGPDFPEITTRDMLAVHGRLLDHLGAGELAAVIGYSYGGYLTYQWGVDAPGRMRALVPVATGITGRGDPDLLRGLEERFADIDSWNDGRFYDDDAAVRAELVTWRIETLKNYGVGDELRDKGLDAAAAEAEILRQAQTWARGFDPNALIVLRRCAGDFDAKPDVSRLQAPVLYVLATTDTLFGPELGEPVVQYIREVAGIEARYCELDTPYGHRGPSVDWQKWHKDLAAFLAEHC